MFKREGVSQTLHLASQVTQWEIRLQSCVRIRIYYFVIVNLTESELFIKKGVAELVII